MMVHLIFNEERLTAALLSSLAADDHIVLNLGVSLTVPQDDIKCPVLTLGAIEGLSSIDGARLYALVKEHGGKVKSYF